MTEKQVALSDEVIIEIVQSVFRLVLGGGGVDFFQIGYHLFDVLPTDEASGGADMMDDTVLKMALWIHGLNCLHHTTQAIRAEQIVSSSLSITCWSTSHVNANLKL